MPECRRASCSARGRHVDRRVQLVTSELGEPRPELGDEVEREAVPPGRDRCPYARLDDRALAGREVGEVRALAVPDDRVVALVEPVVAEMDAVAPRDRAGVLELDARDGRPRRRAVRRASSRASGRRVALSPWAASVGRVEPLLVRAARREPVERTPVWFMRQAGRSLPEYRQIREQHAFFEINRSAELTAEVTLQPVRRHDVDAAVMFADIMTPVVAMGADVELVEGVGPVLAEPVRTLAAVERLRVPDPAETVAPILEAIGAVRRELRADQAVVGFCGGPFTVAGYLVEGRPSRDFAVTKALMYREPDVWHACSRS